MRRFCVLCALCAILVAADGLTINDCVSIEPQSPVLQPSTNLTAFCILDPGCLQEVGLSITARELFWKVGHTVLPESQYTIFNDSVSSVTLQPTLSMHNSVTCSVKLYGQTEYTLIGMYFTLGYPPEKPQNLTCICYNGKTLTCSWEPGRPTIMPTTYTLRQNWTYTKRDDCVAEAGSNSCTLEYPQFMLYVWTVFKVEVQNELGKAESDPVEYSDIRDIMKTDPPMVVQVFPVLERVLRIEWQNPIIGHELIYNIRYRSLDSTQWSKVPAEELEKTLNSFSLQELVPYTTYAVSVRCKLKDRGYWSKWSKEHRSTTAESSYDSSHLSQEKPRLKESRLTRNNRITVLRKSSSRPLRSARV